MNYILAILNLVGLAISLSALFILLEIKLRMIGKTASTFTYLIIATIISMALEVLNLLSIVEIFKVNYLNESLATILLVFLLFGAINFYRCLIDITDKRISPNKKRTIETIKYKEESGDNRSSKQERSGYVDFTRNPSRVDLNKLIRHIKGDS